MANPSRESEVRLSLLAKAAEAEAAVRRDAKARAAALVREWIAEAQEKTNDRIRDCLKAGDRVSHIHNLGLKTRNSGRVYQIKKGMENALVDFEVTMTGYKVKAKPPYLEGTRAYFFETPLGEIAFWEPKTAEEPYEALEAEFQSVIDENREAFAQAARQFFDEHGRDI